MRFPLLDDSSRNFFGTEFLGKLVDEQKVADGARFPLISQMVEQKPIR
jgi:hypothetical protein